MKLTLTEPRFLKESIAIISELVNEVDLKILPDKIELVAMDPANVAMVDFKLLSSAFAEYNVDAPRTIAVNLDNLKAVLRRAKPTDSVVLSIDDEKNKLKVELVGQNKRTFNIALLNAEENEQKVPDLTFTAKAVLPTDQFDEAIEDMDVVAESVALTASPDKFVIKAEGNLNAAQVEMPKTDNVELEAGEETTAKYSLEYLKKMIKGSKLADTATIQFGKDYPLKIDYTVMDRMKLSFILAPRVSND